MRDVSILLIALAFCCWPVQAQHHSHSHSPADAERAAQLQAVRKATEKYRDHSKAVADGFRRFGQDGPLMGEHWYHEDLVRQGFDLRHPSVLQYAVIDEQRVLVGVAYTVYLKAGESIPEGFAGDDDQWHVHDLEKIIQTATTERPLLKWIMTRRLARGKVGGGNGRTRLAMVHAWVWLDNPDGPFAHEHKVIPYLRAGLPASWAETGDSNTAWGTALLEENTCKKIIREAHFLANLSQDQRESLQAACAAATTKVRTRLESDPKNAQKFNEAAARAWRSFDRARSEILTPEQQQRLKAGMEHPQQDQHQHQHEHQP